MTDKQISKMCDQTLFEAAETMIDSGAHLVDVIDRMLTFAAAHTVKHEGRFETGEIFRDMADRIDQGVFSRIEAIPTERMH